MKRPLDLEAMSLSFSRIAQARQWEALHTPQNLACAISVEAAELLSLLQWSGTSDGATSPQIADLAAEMADIALYLNALADTLGVDLAAAVAHKCAHNEVRPNER